MAKVEVFEGRVVLTGGPNFGNPSDKFYRDEVTCYGRTPGELLDNLVGASVHIADNLFHWLLSNKSAEYQMSDDNWYLMSVHPDFEWETLDLTGEDIASSTSVSSLEDIVHSIVLTRDITINRAETLITRRFGIPDFEPATSYTDMYDEPSLREKINYGYTGKNLDALMKQAVERQEQKALLEANASQKPSWWSQFLDRKISSFF